MAAHALLPSGLLSLLAPPRCYACRADLPTEGPSPDWEACLCAPCQEALERLAGACRGCARGLGPHAPDRARCRRCRRSSLGGVRSTTALLRYRGPGRALLRHLKYGNLEALARPLGRELGARCLARNPPRFQARDLVIVPIPLHPWRRWRRGFNQAEAIAEGVAEALERPVVCALKRRRLTRALYGVRPEEREAIVSGAFVTRLIPPGPVLLVDDIRTSGATLRAAARALRREGVRELDAAVVAT